MTTTTYNPTLDLQPQPSASFPLTLSNPVVDMEHLLQWTSRSDFVIMIVCGRKLTVPVGFDSEYACGLVPNPLDLIPHERILFQRRQSLTR